MTLSTSPLHALGVADLSRLLDQKQVSSVELTRHLLDRVESHAALGAFLSVDADVALAQAAAADAWRARGVSGAGHTLLGVPIAHKDIFVTRDFPSTAGSKMLDGYRSPFDATVVSRLAHGAASVGAGGRRDQPGRDRDRAAAG